MKQFLLFLLIQSFLFGENIDTNSTESLQIELAAVEDANSTESLPDEPIVVEDTSGLSDDEIREVAKEADTQVKKKVSISEVIEAIDEKGKVDVSKIQLPWKELSPSPKAMDWVQTKTGEWCRGEIKAMYDDELEFESDEMGLYSFNFEDVAQIKSFSIISVNIEDIASFSGIIRYKEEEITIIQGDKEFKFPSSQIVSLAQDGELERHNWSGKITVSLDIRSGNKQTLDYSAMINIKRRTGETRLAFDYLGRISKVNREETSNDHRINEKFDIYLSRNFFWTPIFSEFYQDKFQNIDQQYTVGAGIGYTFLHTKKFEIDVSGGPAVMHTQYVNVRDGDNRNPTSAALELSTKIEIELTSITDIKYDYKLTFTDDASGKYKHHMVLSFENDLTGWLDLTLTGIWDHISLPEERQDGTVPFSNDYQMLVGLGIEF